MTPTRSPLRHRLWFLVNSYVTVIVNDLSSLVLCTSTLMVVC